MYHQSESLACLPERSEFAAEYERRYGLPPDPTVPLEVTALRSTLSVESSLVLPTRAHSEAAQPSRQVPVFLPGENQPRPVTCCERAALAAGTTLDGPAVVVESSSTLWLPPDARLRVEPDGVLSIMPWRTDS